jgi:hypothetical protein
VAATSSKNGAAARTRSVGTKLTEEEFARLETLAAESRPSVNEMYGRRFTMVRTG